VIEITQIRQGITREVFDYQVLPEALSGYSKPRDKITKLLASGSIVRIKKGRYCFSESLRREAISREYVANLIYGPSYVSLDYAFSYHGLIPERVNTITSVTMLRPRLPEIHLSGPLFGLYPRSDPGPWSLRFSHSVPHAAGHNIWDVFLFDTQVPSVVLCSYPKQSISVVLCSYPKQNSYRCKAPVSNSMRSLTFFQEPAKSGSIERFFFMTIQPRYRKMT